MSITRLFPLHFTQLSISSFMSSPAIPGPWLSSYESDASDEDEVLNPEVSAEDMVDAGGEVLIHPSFADDPDFSRFVSVADLKRTLGGSSIDFSMFCFGTPTGGRVVGQLPLPPLSRLLLKPRVVPSGTLVLTWDTLPT
jgi:hypothetical protein